MIFIDVIRKNMMNIELFSINRKINLNNNQIFFQKHHFKLGYTHNHFLAGYFKRNQPKKGYNKYF